MFTEPFAASTHGREPVSPASSFKPPPSLCCSQTGFLKKILFIFRDREEIVKRHIDVREQHRSCERATSIPPYSLPLNAQASSCQSHWIPHRSCLVRFNSKVTSFSEAVPDQPHTTPHPHTSPPPTPASCITLISTRDDIALRRHLHLSPQEEHNCPLIGRGQGCCQTSYHAQTDPTTNDYLAPNATAEKPGPVTICSFSAALIGAGIDGLGAGVPY